MSTAPAITAFFDEATNSVSYLVADPATGTGALIDPVLDFDPASGTISTASVERMLSAADAQDVRIAWVLETHVHADHLSAAAVIRERTGAKVAIGRGVADVQAVFAPMLGAGDLDGGDFDRLLADGDRIDLGALTIEVIATPGHTPACVSYKVGDAVFVGDTLFMPDYGTARCDFPGGCADQLYQSIQRILALPRETRLFLCHDYKAPGRDSFAWETTVGEEGDRNVHVGGGKSAQDFAAMRRARDATLCAPKLLYPAIQVNIRGGRLPPAEADGSVFLKIPVTLPSD
jgi:glyoxylase-like metal-dependent hydrolase (beta-lactamase superfamily II)